MQIKELSGHIIDENINATNVQWENANSVADATLYFMRFFESPQHKATYDQSGTWGESRLTRAERYYSEFRGKEAPDVVDVELTGDNKEKMQNLIKEAKRIAADDRYTYSQPLRNDQWHYDCSSYVSRLYQQYFGITPRLDAVGSGRGTDNIRSRCHSQYTVIRGSPNPGNLKPGDILWKDGHVALYIGNNQIAEAQGTAAGIVVGTFRAGRFTEAYRIIK